MLTRTRTCIIKIELPTHDADYVRQDRYQSKVHMRLPLPARSVRSTVLARAHLLFPVSEAGVDDNGVAWSCTFVDLMGNCVQCDGYVLDVSFGGAVNLGTMAAKACPHRPRRSLPPRLKLAGKLQWFYRIADDG